MLLTNEIQQIQALKDSGANDVIAKLVSDIRSSKIQPANQASNRHSLIQMMNLSLLMGCSTNIKINCVSYMHKRAMLIARIVFDLINLLKR